MEAYICARYTRLCEVFYVHLKGCVSSVVASYILGVELVEMSEVEGVA